MHLFIPMGAKFVLLPRSEWGVRGGTCLAGEFLQPGTEIYYAGDAKDGDMFFHKNENEDPNADVDYCFHKSCVTRIKKAKR